MPAGTTLWSLRARAQIAEDPADGAQAGELVRLHSRGREVDRVQELVGRKILGLPERGELLDDLARAREGGLAELADDDLAELLRARWLDVQPYAATQEGRRELPFAVA